ncbi:MAG: hypothetical protein IT349_02045 [Candidatus Eisenbacteria bacterium]|nr:hypothetical protein [Candidatus Eisenbacteria bacterium]MCC7140860.1 hypothetical protein [Candidatus Eisenbacteria bacterium]
MNHHPNSDSILAHVAAVVRGLAGDQEVASHVGECTRCAEQVTEIQSVISALRVARLEEAPDAWMMTALERIEELEAAHRSPTLAERVRGGVAAARDGIKRIVEEVEAALVLDSHAGALLPGIRGNATMAPRQLLFGSPFGQILLQIDTHGKKHDIRGQFLPIQGEIGPEARAMVTHGNETIEVSISSTGEFFFAELTSGRVRLRVEAAGYAVTLAPMNLPPGAEI